MTCELCVAAFRAVPAFTCDSQAEAGKLTAQVFDPNRPVNEGD